MRTASLALAGLLAVGVSACSAGDQGDGPLGDVQQAQIDPGFEDYLIYQVFDLTGLMVGQVLVTATAGGGYDADTEYYYMTTNVSNGSTITFTSGNAQYWSTPPSGLGTLSFKMNRAGTWTHGNLSGTMPFYQNGLTGEWLGLNWGMTNTGGTWSGFITYYHSVGTNLFGPNLSRTLAPRTIHTMGYYSINTPL